MEILSITQSSIQNALEALFKNEDWGHPQGYDITVKRVGKGMDTEYSITPSPHKPMTAGQKEALESKPINLEALYSGGNPFGEVTGEEGYPTEDLIKASGLPF